jgi:hypothetical protein
VQLAASGTGTITTTAILLLTRLFLLSPLQAWKNAAYETYIHSGAT